MNLFLDKTDGVRILSCVPLQLNLPVSTWYWSSVKIEKQMIKLQFVKEGGLA